MPNIRSAEKRLRQNKKRRFRNKNFTSQVKTSVKKFEAAMAANDVEAAKREFREVARTLDSVAQKGIIPRNMASRKKSRLHKRLTALAGAASTQSQQPQAEANPK